MHSLSCFGQRRHTQWKGRLGKATFNSRWQCPRLKAEIPEEAGDAVPAVSGTRTRANCDVKSQHRFTPARRGRLWEKRLCSCQSWTGASGGSHQRESRLEGKASGVAGGQEKGHWRAGWSLSTRGQAGTSFTSWGAASQVG